jgi:uncharacterized membrane protein YhiD involved in acid resistance
MIGVERELRSKPAGISTNCFVMAGACLFTFGSGVGFLGAGT